jgi:hypothetical protein
MIAISSFSLAGTSTTNSSGSIIMSFGDVTSASELCEESVIPLEALSCRHLLDPEVLFSILRAYVAGARCLGVGTAEGEGSYWVNDDQAMHFQDGSATLRRTFPTRRVDTMTYVQVVELMVKGEREFLKWWEREYDRNRCGG